jgi:hypothetical protein
MVRPKRRRGAGAARNGLQGEVWAMPTQADIAAEANCPRALGAVFLPLGSWHGSGRDAGAITRGSAFGYRGQTEPMMAAPMQAESHSTGTRHRGTMDHPRDQPLLTVHDANPASARPGAVTGWDRHRGTSQSMVWAVARPASGTPKALSDLPGTTYQIRPQLPLPPPLM